MKQLGQVLIAAVRREIFGGDLSIPFSSECSDSFYSRLFALAKAHDLAHVVGKSLIEAGAPLGEDTKALFERESFAALLRYERQRLALDRVLSLFKEEGVPAIPLKGSVLRDLYPTPWMRTSCDIDILVPKEKLSFAAALLSERSDFRQEGKTSHHDIAFRSGDGTRIELHFSLDTGLPRADAILSTVWETATQNENGIFIMTDDLFLLHQVAHTASHFRRSGCGIRPVLDLAAYRGVSPVVPESAIALLREAGLLPFYESMRKLCKVWFTDEAHTSLSEAMESYLLSAGTYGTLRNFVAKESAPAKSSFRYLLSRIFMPYRELLVTYPVLRRAKILYPFLSVVRWVRIVFSGRIVRAAKVACYAFTEKGEGQKRILDLHVALQLDDHSVKK